MLAPETTFHDAIAELVSQVSCLRWQRRATTYHAAYLTPGERDADRAEWDADWLDALDAIAIVLRAHCIATNAMWN